MPVLISHLVHARTKVTGSGSRSTVRSYQCSSLIFSPRSAPTCAIAKPFASFPFSATVNSTISASPVSRSKTLRVRTSPHKRPVHCTPCSRPLFGGHSHLKHQPRGAEEALMRHAPTQYGGFIQLIVQGSTASTWGQLLRYASPSARRLSAISYLAVKTSCERLCDTDRCGGRRPAKVANCRSL
jgi:hypothetical protein